MRLALSKADSIGDVSAAGLSDPQPGFWPGSLAHKADLPIASSKSRSECRTLVDSTWDSILRTGQERLSFGGPKAPRFREPTMPATVVLKSKICLVGERAVGKTSLIRRYVQDEFDDKYVRTLGAKIEKKTLQVDLPERSARVDVSMAIWDIIGHVGFRQLLGDSFFNGAQGVLAVADVTRRDTLAVLPGWIEAVESVSGKVPVILVANKTDLTQDAQVGEGDVAGMAKDLGCTYTLTSAKSGRNVEEAFLSLGTLIVKARLTGSLRPDSSPFSGQSKPS
jgi:small GTP-binding protein